MENFSNKKLNVFSLLSYEKFKIAIGIFLGSICGLLSFVPYVVLYKMIAALINNQIDFKSVLPWALVMIFSTILQNILMSITMIFTHVAAYNIIHRLKMEALEYLSKVSLGFFNNKTSGELKAALFDDIEKL